MLAGVNFGGSSCYAGARIPNPFSLSSKLERGLDRVAHNLKCRPNGLLVLETFTRITALSSPRSD